MRILQVVPRYAPAWAFGGGVRITYDLAKAWVRNGHEVTVFTSDQQSEQHRFAEEHAVIDGIKIRRFRNRWHRLAARFSFLFFQPMGLRAALKNARFDFDIVHIAESRGAHNRIVDRALVQGGFPVVWSPYGGLADGEGIRRGYRKMHDAIYGTRRMVRGVTGLVAQTSHEAEVFGAFGAERRRIRIIPLAVDPAAINPLPARGAFRRKVGVAETDKLILFLGRLHHTKGLQVLVPAFAEVVRKDPQIKLVIVGWDQGYKRQIERLTAQLNLNDKVIFAGALYDRERFQAYVDADLFALTPGVYEETSLAALEACACGTSCVITDQCEIPGLDRAEAGVTVAYNRESVGRALLQAFQRGDLRKRGENARQLIKERFAVDVVAREHEKLFSEICETRS